MVKRVGLHFYSSISMADMAESFSKSLTMPMVVLKWQIKEQKRTCITAAIYSLTQQKKPEKISTPRCLQRASPTCLHQSQVGSWEHLNLQTITREMKF